MFDCIENEISYEIRGAIYTVCNSLGPGLLESVYEAALMHELKTKGFRIANQVVLPVKYKEVYLEVGFRIDILVDDLVPIEVKSTSNLADIHHKQLHTYMKLANYKLGILVNFNTMDINQSIVRIVNNL